MGKGVFSSDKRKNSSTTTKNDNSEKDSLSNFANQKSHILVGK